MKKYKNIFLVNADPIKNAGSIKEYFINYSENFTSFHFFPGYSKKNPYCNVYQNGELIYEKKFAFYKGNNFIMKNFVVHLLFFYVAFFKVKRKSILITNAPLFLFGNSLLKKIKLITPVLWLGDYYESTSFFMKFYNKLVFRYNNTLKYVIYLNPRLRDIYSKNTKQRSRKVISLGIRKNFKNFNKNLDKKIYVGFIGVIRKQQGLDLFFKYLAENNNCFLEIVGDGYYLDEYKKLANKMNIQNKVKFYGSVENLSEVFQKWDLGIALYENTEDNLSIYAEPTKIKDYLSYGLPVITTKTTYFYEEIKKYNSGIVVEESTKSLGEAIEEIKINYSKYLKGVEKIVNHYEYEEWYDKNFKFLRRL